MTKLGDVAHEEPQEHPTPSRLRLIASPVVRDNIARQESSARDERGFEQRDLENLGYRYAQEHDCPEFIKHSASTNYELFYDLWFVANLAVFSTVHEVTEDSKLYSYLGYVTVLWFTWFTVGMFDVRFVADSIFERLARTVHLGVMAGFAVVASRFDPDDQMKATFQGMSFILMVSRLILVVQYSTIMWHIRYYKEGKWTLAVVTAFHFITAMAYLGIAFQFQDDKNSRVFVAWYVIAVCEALFNLGLSLESKVLSFNGTHLTERLTLLTLIILGEGIVTIAKNVVLIVKNDGWTSATIGVLTAAIATVYMFFMIYFDWMNHHHLSGIRQLTWAILHFPFHVALLLFMEGATQFITWWKLLEVQNFATDEFTNVATKLNATGVQLTSNLVAQSLNSTVCQIWDMYRPTYQSTLEEVATVLTDVRNITNDYWYEDNNPELEARFNKDISDLLVTVTNSVFVNFNVDPFQEDLSDDESSGNLAEIQYSAISETNDRFVLVFQYAYATAGIALILLTILYVLTKKHGWKLSSYIRTGVFFLIGCGLSLVVLLSIDDVRSAAFLTSPFLLPTLAVVFFIVLVLTHLPSAPPPPLLFTRKRQKTTWRSGTPQINHTTIEQDAGIQPTHHGFDFTQQQYVQREPSFRYSQHSMYVQDTGQRNAYFPQPDNYGMTYIRNHS